MLKFIRAVDIPHGILIQYLPYVLRRGAQEIDVLRVGDCGVPEVIITASKNYGFDGVSPKTFVFFRVWIDDISSFFIRKY